MSEECVYIYTDGACRGNPGPGGWGAVLRFRGQERELYGATAETTNNRMELTAVIRALETLKRSCKVEVVTDSKYVKQGMTEWLPGWKQRNWRSASGSPVKNQDLWTELDTQAQRHKIEWYWVRGHSGHPENERADQLANAGIDALLAGEPVEN